MQTKFRNKDKKSCLLAQFFPSSYCFMTFVPAKNFKQVVTAESLNASKIQITGIPGKYIERFFVQLCQVLY